MCASVTVVPFGNPATLIWKSAGADVRAPYPSRAPAGAIVPDRVAPASALVIAGTSFAADIGTVKVEVDVDPGPGVVGLLSEHPTTRTLRPMMSVESRFMMCCLPFERSLRR